MAEQRTPATFTNPMPPREAVALADLFKVIADPSRLRLLSLIAADPGVRTQELVPLMGVRQSTVTHHLSRLRWAGLVDRRKRSGFGSEGTVPLHVAPGAGQLADYLRRWFP